MFYWLSCGSWKRRLWF